MEYLVGLALLGALWSFLFWFRKDLRWAMTWSGVLYVLVLSVGFIAIKLIWPDMPAERTIVPGYWNPDTLFDLGRRTGGYAIEDAMYGFLTGGVAAATYETFFRRRLSSRHARHHPHIAISAAAAGGFIVAATGANLIWSLIAFGFCGAAVVWAQRPDLVKQSLYGGFAYTIVYTGVFIAFLFVFPEFVREHYGLQNLLGHTTFGIPIEEYLFAFSFGLLWSPIYEYMKDLR